MHSVIPGMPTGDIEEGAPNLTNSNTALVSEFNAVAATCEEALGNDRR